MGWLWIIQIFADLLLIGAVALLLLKLRKLEKLPGLATGQGLAEFFDEAGKLSKEFDRLLIEKRRLAQGALDSLDQRIAQLKKAALELERPPAAPVAAKPGSKAGGRDRTGARTGQGMDGFKQVVLTLAKQGKAPAQIAKATGRPQGEVELVLSLEAQKSS